MGAALALLALAVVPVPGVAAGAAANPPKPEADAATKKAGTETAESLAGILAAMEVLEAGERRLRLLLADEGRLRVLQTEIEDVEKSISGMARMTDGVTNDLVGFGELVDVGNVLREADRRLTAAGDDLSSQANALDTALDRLTAAGARTATWLEIARTRNAPAALQQRIEAMIPQQAALARELLARRDRVLEVLSRTTQLHAVVSAQRAEVSGRRDRITSRLRTERSVPIWKVEASGSEWRRVVGYFDARVAQSLRFVREQALLLLAIAAVFFALTHRLIVATRAPLAAQAVTDSYARRACTLFQAPALAAWVAAVAAVIGFGPSGPVSYYHLLWVLLFVPGVLLLRTFVGPGVSLSLYTLVGAAISQDLLGSVLDPLPIASRLLLIAQCGGLAAALSADLVRGRFEEAFPHWPAALVRWSIAGFIALLVLSVLATVTGYLGTARILRILVLGGISLALLLAVLAGLVYGFALALMHTAAGRRLRTVRLYEPVLQRRLRKGLILVACVAWLSGMVIMLGLGDDAARTIDAIHHAEITIGSTSIDLTGVWAGLAVILGTLILVKVVAPVLELEILPRLTRSQGLPFAVAAVTRYLLITAGVLLALAAMGVDFTKVTLLAGALGVGIGFGLQGVVNNFVSGLILLTERPVNVGDIIQMGALHGTIRRIGVRSSTVQTFQGAEVIVPNADLISKEVTNWTLSDRRRRLEIDIGVAYDTEPEQVVKLLEAAAKEVAEVVAYPPPLAWCIGFGESALNFRLQAWIDDYARGLANESALRMAIAKKFREANIEIPFPQRDVHIRTAPAAPVTPSTGRS
jgi:small-conductance mechanosensitive channel